MAVALVGSVNTNRGATLVPMNGEAKTAPVDRKTIIPETSGYINKYYKNWMNMLNCQDEKRVKAFLTKVLQLQGEDFNVVNVNNLIETELGGSINKIDPNAFKRMAINGRGEIDPPEKILDRWVKSVEFYASTNSDGCHAAYLKYSHHKGDFYSVNSETGFYKANKFGLLTGANSTSFMDALRRAENKSEEEIRGNKCLKLIVDTARENGYIELGKDDKYRIVVSNDKKAQEEAEKDVEERAVIAAARKLHEALPSTFSEFTYIPIFRDIGITLPGDKTFVTPEQRAQDVFQMCNKSPSRQNYEKQIPDILNGIFDYKEFERGKALAPRSGPIVPTQQ